MGCIYENNSFGDEDGGKCNFFDDEGDGIDAGYDEKGYCCCSDDPDPADSCSCYESDYTCYDCGADLNIGECDCEED
jgi:hypothetical protein